MGNEVTIQDIADELGLSRNTVSKALNNAQGLASDTRERIIRKAIELGYKQFAYTQAILSAQLGDQVNTPSVDPLSGGEIALFSAGFLNGSHFASLMLDWFQNAITRLGLTLSIHRITEDHLTKGKPPEAFRRDRTTAIICFEMFDQSYDEALCQLGMPILFVDGPARIGERSLPMDQLYMDNRTSISQLGRRASASSVTTDTASRSMNAMLRSVLPCS